MSKYSIDSTTLTAIGDAVRSKTGGSDPILVSNLATAISGITTGGGDLSLTYVKGTPIQCRYNNMKLDFVLPITDYLPSDISKLKVLIGIEGTPSGDCGIWYNKSANLINATVSSYINENGQEITNAGTCPILIGGFYVKVGYNTINNPDPNCLALINGKLYTVVKNGNGSDYIYKNTSSFAVSNHTFEYIIIKEA